MVEPAQGEAILNSRLPERIGVRHDVRRFEQLVSFKSTHGAVVQIGANNALAKGGLVQPLPEHPGRISASDWSLLNVRLPRAQVGKGPLVDADREGQLGNVVANDVNRPLRSV